MISDMGKKVLVVGSGGRCHAIVDALSRSAQVEKIYCAPGNAGIAEQAENVAIGVENVEALRDFACENGIDLTVVGPEASLAAGIADVFAKAGLRILGPTKEATMIESSKEYAKSLMMRHGIPTGAYESFDDFEKALSYVKSRPLPAVVKYDGLAAGKGVVVAATYEEAEAALRDMLLDESFGKGRVIVEEFLDGPEFSFLCLVNGEKVYPLELSQDHKRAFDGDKGPNTGGMGAYSPVPFISDDVKREALEKIMKPTAAALVADGRPFCGVLYGGLILTADGPKVIEFNARFGDPETEVVLPRLKSDIYDFFTAVIDGKDFTPEWSDERMLGIVLASKGYPGSYKKSVEINGLDKVGCRVYHMGTRREDGKLLTSGGRVLMVVGSGASLSEAREKALADISEIECDNLFHRSDIGRQAID